MDKYIVRSLVSDCYERFAVLQTFDGTKEFMVHFLQYDECLDLGEVSKKIKVGDIIEGRLYMDFIMESEKTDGQLMWAQLRKGDYFTNAVVRISEVIDDYSVYAKSSLCESPLLLEFEDKVNYAVGDTVAIEGALELILSAFDEDF